MNVQHFFDKETYTLTYVVYDRITRDAVIIDPVLDFDPSSGEIESKSLIPVLNFLQEHHLTPHYCLETHAHADHLSSSQLLKEIYPNIQVGISERIQTVQKTFKDIFNFSDEFQTNGCQFDKLIKDNEVFMAGSIKIEAIATPGHTPACMSFHINNMLFCGDTLFIEDSGTGRCDFPDGSAQELYRSVREKLYRLPDETIVFVGHDYCPNERELRFETTIGKSKSSNIHLNELTTEGDYVMFRENRDKSLKAPRLLFASIQVNLNAGTLPSRLVMPLFNKIKKM